MDTDGSFKHFTSLRKYPGYEVDQNWVSKTPSIFNLKYLDNTVNRYGIASTNRLPISGGYTYRPGVVRSENWKYTQNPDDYPRLLENTNVDFVTEVNKGTTDVRMMMKPPKSSIQYLRTSINTAENRSSSINTSNARKGILEIMVG